jgi:protease II
MDKIICAKESSKTFAVYDSEQSGRSFVIYSSTDGRNVRAVSASSKNHPDSAWAKQCTVEATSQMEAVDIYARANRA